MQEYIESIEHENYMKKKAARFYLDEARAEMKRTLATPSTELHKDDEDEDAPQIKQNRKMTKAEARRMLRRTQAALWR